MARRSADVMFTGGVPYDSVEDVFRALSSAVGGRALGYPDGELGERSGWVTSLGDSTWPKVAGLEQASTANDLGGDAGSITFKQWTVREGVTDLDLRGLLPYSHAAIEAYEIFTRLREDGVVPPGVRYQMQIPASFDAVLGFFPEPADWPIAMGAWATAVNDEYARMLDVIPADDLSIQIDYCAEVLEASGVHLFPYAPILDDFLATYASAEYLQPLVAALPDEVLLGFHICAGTFPSFPVADLPDISLAVRAANMIVANAGRRVDFVHLPAMQDSDETYFAPLRELRVGHAQVFLGLECNDGPQEMTRRIEAAAKHLQGFGVAHYCGYLWNKEIMPRLLSDLNVGADHLAEARR
jgi:hypothetical protein